MRSRLAAQLRFGLRTIEESAARAPVTSRVSSRPVCASPFSTCSPLRQAAVAPGQPNMQPPPSEMDSTLDRLVPPISIDHLPVSNELARRITSSVLTQLRSAPDLPSPVDKVRLQTQTDEAIKSDLISARHTASDLRNLANILLIVSQDPRRQPIAFRLFEIAYAGPASRSLALESVEVKEKAKQIASIRARKDEKETLTSEGWWDDDAGYSWASMVLSNTAPPPTDGGMRSRYDEAIETYKRLANRGNSNGKLGLGRLLLKEVHKGSLDKNTKTAVIERLTGLWKEAGERGLAEAWYELGTLYLGGKHVTIDEGQAKQYFQQGAELNHPGSHYALGVICSKEAESLSGEERQEVQEESLHHFLQAASRGDVQSMYNVGVRYLLQASSATKSPAFLSGQATLKDIHRERWGINPNDIQARNWFERAAAKNFAPAIMNLAGMLVDERGNPPDKALPRVQSLRLGMALYAKVVAMGSASSSVPDGGRSGLAAFGMDREGAEEMVKLAQSELEKVEKLLEKES